MMRRLMLAGAFVLAATAGQAAEAIEGNWKTASGETATIAACGGAYCVTLKTGQHAGKQIGRLAGSDGRAMPARLPIRPPTRLIAVPGPWTETPSR